MEEPQIHAFSNDRTHSADDLNVMGIAILELVLQVNSLSRRLEELEPSQAAPKGNARKTA